MTMEDVIAEAERELLKFNSPWNAVRRIVLSRGRFDELREKAVAAESTRPLNTFAAIDIEVSSFCDDRIAVLVDGHGQPIGLFSFETGEARWFDKNAMRRAMEPSFTFEPVEDDTFSSRRYLRYGFRL